MSVEAAPVSVIVVVPVAGTLTARSLRPVNVRPVAASHAAPLSEVMAPLPSTFRPSLKGRSRTSF